jgi:putative tryptophan/tyrosine transport system substrate-binding protein
VPEAAVQIAVALAVLALLAAPFAAQAQQAAKVFQIGYLGNATPTLESALLEGFRLGLRERGYVEGQNIVVHYRWAEGRIDLLSGLAVELVRLKVDLIVTSGTPATLAAKQATTTMPIVMAASGDAVGGGLV